MSAVLVGTVPIDWDVAQRIAASSKFNCVAALDAGKAEVKAALENANS